MRSLDKAINRLASMEDDFPRLAFSSHSDAVSVFLTNEQYRTECIDDFLTAHYSLSSGELVGCTLARVSRLAAKYHHFCNIEDVDVTLTVLLFAACPADDERHFYWDLRDKLPEFVIPKEALEASHS